jgi:adenine phosphoribosyltransferase
VAVVDDVISTGASVCAALNILRRVGAEPVVIGAMLTEASTWRAALGDDAALVHALGGIPVFRREPAGGIVEDWDGSSDRDILPASATTEK